MNKTSADNNICGDTYKFPDLLEISKRDNSNRNTSSVYNDFPRERQIVPEENRVGTYFFNQPSGELSAPNTFPEYATLPRKRNKPLLNSVKNLPVSIEEYTIEYDNLGPRTAANGSTCDLFKESETPILGRRTPKPPPKGSSEERFHYLKNLPHVRETMIISCDDSSSSTSLLNERNSNVWLS